MLNRKMNENCVQYSSQKMATKYESATPLINKGNLQREILIGWFLGQQVVLHLECMMWNSYRTYFSSQNFSLNLENVKIKKAIYGAHFQELIIVELETFFGLLSFQLEFTNLMDKQQLAQRMEL